MRVLTYNTTPQVILPTKKQDTPLHADSNRFPGKITQDPSLIVMAFFSQLSGGEDQG